MYSVVRTVPGRSCDHPSEQRLLGNVVPPQQPSEAQRKKSAERFLFQGKFGIRNKTKSAH